MALRFFSALALVGFASITAVACGGSDDNDQGASVAASASVTVGSGGSGTGGSGGAASTGSMTGTTSSTGGFMTAPHEATPTVADNGGKTIASPKVKVIEWESDPVGGAHTVDDVVAKIGASQYWAATTSEYGVGPLTVSDPVHRTDAAPTGKIDGSSLLMDLQTNTTGASPAWGAADPNTIYLFVLPAGVEVNDGGYCCEDFDGFHDEAIFSGITGGSGVPYAMVCQCPGFDGPNITDLEQLTVVTSHELIEAATDPYVEASPAYEFPDDNHVGWGLVTGGEVGDMCSFQQDYPYTAPDLGGYTVQRSWSNKAALAGTNPCVPTDKSEPYFNAVPVLDDTVTLKIPGFGNITTKGASIPIGMTKTIELDLFSDAPTANWQVAAYDWGDFTGQAKELTLSLDKPSGNNGDKLELTVTPVMADPQFKSEPFFIICDSDDGRENMWIGLVTN